MKDVLSLPFDQYQRYRLVADLVTRLAQGRDGAAPLCVLDVGGRTALLRSFLPDVRVELVDMEASEEHGLVLGDGSQLPFKDRSVDIVACFDTLEHVPPERREAFVAECARVARHYTFIAGPYQSPQVDAAEEHLQAFMKDKLDLEHRYLEEHRSNGLPIRAETEAQLRAAGGQVCSYGHGNLERWLALMCMELYMDHDPLLRPIAARFFEFYNRTLYASDHAAPVYRHILIAAFDGAPIPPLDDLLSAPVAPDGSARAVLELGERLLDFDLEKDVWRKEFTRLEGIIGDVEEDLSGHKSRLSDTRGDLQQTRSSLQELEEIHTSSEVEHATEKETLRADLRETESSLKEQTDIYEKTLREHAQVSATLQAEIDETLRTLEDMRAEFAASQVAAVATAEELRAEIAQHTAVAEELRGIVEETQAGAQAIEAELLRARSEIDGLVGQLGQRDERIEFQVRELRDRWKNMKRALAFKKAQY